MRQTSRTQLYSINNRTEWTWAVMAMQGFEYVFGIKFRTCGRALKHTHFESKKRTIWRRFGGPFEVRRPFLRLLEACENADAKLDGKKPPGDENFGSPGGMRGGPGGTIGRLIKRQKFQAYMKRQFRPVAGSLTRRGPDSAKGSRAAD